MTWFERGGSRIYFEQEGLGDAVLFLPGWSETISEFASLRRALATRYTVVAADLPGSGKSEPQPREYPVSYYRDDAQSFAALLEELGLAPAHVTGFSDGGEVALVMAVDSPSVVRSVSAWGAAGSLAASPEMLDAFSVLIDEPPEPMREFAEYLKHAYGEANARAMTKSVVAAWRAIVEAGSDISRSAAGSIACPTLLITGELDGFAPPGVVSELADAIPIGEFIEVKGAGHSLHEDHGEWLADIILKRLRSWGPG